MTAAIQAQPDERVAKKGLLDRLVVRPEIVPVGATEVSSALRMPCRAICARTSSSRPFTVSPARYRSRSKSGNAPLSAARAVEARYASRWIVPSQLSVAATAAAEP